MERYKRLFKKVSESNNLTNVNIGIERRNQKLIDQVEFALDFLGIYYDNDGGDNRTYNINAGFSNPRNADKFIAKWGKKVDYLDTETFENL